MNSVVAQKVERYLRPHFRHDVKCDGFKLRVEADWMGFRCVLYHKGQGIRFEGRGTTVEDAIEDAAMKAN